ncbi:MAG: 23S rRNA (adenine(2503)-C(2))-methyltransferase RlmN, partial [candidate division Zixibacteria bacterium]|nr:23S rRNA (adenine(2503)-C(2))-methyltransferase RlmN [candidate division Zixibacteria bacterium]
MSNEATGILGQLPEELAELAGRLGGKPFHGNQVFRWVNQRGVFDFEQMSDLPKSLRKTLKKDLFIGLPRVVHAATAAGDGATKLLLQYADRQEAEAVIIRDRGKITLCLSTQIGCPLGCTFCMTGAMGFLRNLTAGEIVGQFLFAQKHLKAGESVRNIVLMGMGEPLLNYDATLKAMRIITSELGPGLSARRITLSTAGIVPKIQELADETIKLKLAISLHAATNEKRNLLVPLNKKYPLEQLLPAAEAFARRRKRRITFEYILIEGLNDTPEDALLLAKKVAPIPCKINLIPYNPTPFAPYKRPSIERINRFREILFTRTSAVTVRFSKGGDV